MNQTDLSDEELRVRVAEACGWYSITTNEWGYRPRGFSPNNPQVRHRHRWNVPSFVFDLSAIHEAEKTLSERQKLQYVEEIGKLARDEQAARGLNPRSMEDREVIFHHLHATARQRCIAFLMVKSPME